MEDDYAEFFKRLGDASVQVWTYKDSDYEMVTVEDLYQQFKARMLAEMRQSELARKQQEAFGAAANPSWLYPPNQTRPR